jgi:hypothetical protein
LRFKGRVSLLLSHELAERTVVEVNEGVPEVAGRTIEQCLLVDHSLRIKARRAAL